jgi:methyl-accepting chemotaxis protein
MSGQDYRREERLKFLGIDDGTTAALDAFRETVEARLPGVIESFYAYLRQWPELWAMFGGEQNVTRIKATQGQHWKGVLAGRFDDAYMEGVRRIGQTHERIGLEPRWYIGGYCFALNKLVEVAVEKYARKPKLLVQVLRALNQAVFLDMDLAISIYQETGKVNFQNRLDGLADELDSNVGSVVQVLSSAASELQAAAQGMTSSVEQVSRQSSMVAAAAEEATSSVETVAAAAEELTSSVAEIGRQVEQSTRIAQQAVTEAERTNATMQSLATAAQKIGEVVSLINAIAGQTNLLALNATIEAARAGEAGKGFAVVASEVKSLATQTARATEEIGAQISAIQSVTNDAVKAIGGIGSTINQMSEIATAIASAVQEQGAATQEIARNVTQAANGTRDVSENIGHVATASGETGTAASQVLQSSGELARESEQLRSKVDQFLSGVRAA